MLKWAGWYIFCGEENGWIITMQLQEVLCKQCYVKTEDFYKLRVKAKTHFITYFKTIIISFEFV